MSAFWEKPINESLLDVSPENTINLFPILNLYEYAGSASPCGTFIQSTRTLQSSYSNELFFISETLIIDLKSGRSSCLILRLISHAIYLRYERVISFSGGGPKQLIGPLWPLCQLRRRSVP